MVDPTIVAVSGVSGLFIGPLIVRMLAGMAPGGLSLRAAKWQINRGLAMGDRWVLLQCGDRDYELEHPDDSDVVGGKYGHIDAGAQSIPFATAYDEQAVAESSLIARQDEPPVSTERPTTRTADELLQADQASNGYSAGGEA